MRSNRGRVWMESLSRSLGMNCCAGLARFNFPMEALMAIFHREAALTMR